MQTRWILAATMILAGSSLTATLAGGGDFDHLSDADRQIFQERFAKEVLPALQRGGKNSCMSCHGSGGKGGGSLRMTGDAAKDFRMLLKEGFFLTDDSGSLLTRVTTKDKKQQMPPPGRGDRWEKADIEQLQKFVVDLDKKQKKK